MSETNQAFTSGLCGGTGHKGAEAQLAVFAHAFEGTSELICITDLEDRFTFVNRAFLEAYGYAEAEILGQHPGILYAPDNPPTLLPEILEQSRLGGWRGEVLNRRKDGTAFPVFLNTSKIADKTGRVIGLMGVARDITGRKRAEKRNAAFSNLGLRLSSATTQKDAAWIIVQVADELWGWDACTVDLYSSEEDTVRSVLALDTINGRRVEIAPRRLDAKPSPRARRIMTQGSELILREPPIVLPPDSIPFGDEARPSASLMLVPIRNGPRVIGLLSIQSYTPKAYTPENLQTLQALADHCGGALERIRAEETSRAGEERLRTLIANIPGAVYRLRPPPDWSVEFISDVIADISGYPACDFVADQARAYSSVIHPQDQAFVRKSLMEKLALRQPYEMQYRLVRADERIRWVHEKGQGVFDREGKLLCLDGVILDITEWKQAEIALKQSQEWLSAILGASRDGMVVEANEQIVYVNDSFARLYRYAGPAELIGQPISAVHSPKDAARLQEWGRQRARGESAPSTFECKGRRKDGTLIDVEASVSTAAIAGKTYTIMMVRDIADRLSLEEQLRQAQKMESIGQLAGGIAHDFNNILTIIQGNASLLLSENLPEITADSARQISLAAQRAANLTRQLLMFSRRQVLQLRTLDLGEVVSGMIKMLRRVLGEDVALEVQYASALPRIKADQGMMEQILLNLVLNARDAMPKGGKLTIATSAVTIDEAQAQQNPEATTGQAVGLSVSDSGCGIPPEDLSHIFEPFFTTKDIGKGTGLGLATVYGIVKQHGGWIRVVSEVDKGAIFQVFLPSARETAGIIEEAPTPKPVRGGTETILVVEDELAVRVLLLSLLERQGYQVLEAASGLAAVKVWREHQAEIDLLLTDLVMPEGMSGQELAEKLQSEKPQLKILYTSGYSADIAGQDLVIREGFNFLQKPYSPQKLLKAVRDCLDRAG
ncbi:MAG: PAS domain S-box protein [Chloroflexi bacterium]|nr:PAS domain S-box protein [Chloroflexota bacterium]